MRKNENYYIGKVFTNSLICFFTEYNDLQVVIDAGARFQSLIPSLMNVAFLKSITPFSTKVLSFLVLICLRGFSKTGSVILKDNPHC